ncbi:MAG: quinolinate synthase NadA, partial [Clostridia bacterium]|nr:quinolinate synthase NadA [Clostridia bacterium]
NIVKKINNNNILFIPDCNLGAYVAQEVPQKNIKLIKGGCPVHAAVTLKEVIEAKKMHPDALLLVHPECIKEVTQAADFAGSTADIIDYAINSDHNEFIIGTENNIAEHLKFMCPHKKFYNLSKYLICADMRLTTITDVYNCIAGEGGEEIVLDNNTISSAKKCIDEMIRLNNE